LVVQRWADFVFASRPRQGVWALIWSRFLRQQ
jgi:hypothetical protein